jgi:hypothetical protein
MGHEQVEKGIALLSVMIYVPLSVGAALLFLLAATIAGEAPIVARIGGAVWVLILSLIVSMPLVTSSIKKRLRGC